MGGLLFEADARVIEPEPLQDKVRNEVGKMLSGYGSYIDTFA